MTATTSLGLLACGAAADAGETDRPGQTNVASALKIGPTPINPPVSPNPIPPPAKDHSFGVASVWSPGWGTSEGWAAEEPRLLADVTGDKQADVVGFGYDYIQLGISNGSEFVGTQSNVNFFTYNTGWRTEKHLRMAADLNGDGSQDIVGFFDDGVYSSLGTPSGLGPVVHGRTEFGYNQSWRVANHVRTLASLTHDKNLDIVGFFDDGVYTSTGDGTGTFAPSVHALSFFGSLQGWDPVKTLRTMSDVNNDGLDDIVGFGLDGVYVAFSNGAGGFSAPVNVLNDFSYGKGWRLSQHIRTLADIDRDGKKDIVGFFNDGVYMARCNGAGFDPATRIVADLGYDEGWRLGRHFRAVADLNGDGYLDIVGAGEDSIFRALGGPYGIGPLRPMMRDLVATAGYSTDAEPRFVGDVNNDGAADFVGISDYNARVSLSSTAAPFSAPPPPNDFALIGDSPTTLAFSWIEPVTNTPSDVNEFIVTSLTTFNTEERETLLNVIVPPGAGPSIGRTVTLDTLDSSTTYNVSVQAANLWGISQPTQRLQGTTSAAPPGGVTGTGPANGVTVNACGTQSSCPTGYYPAGYTADYNCRVFASLPALNAVTCQPALGQYVGCGFDQCVPGYHAVFTLYTPSCDLGGVTGDTSQNATECLPNTTTPFTACVSCPAGYLQSPSVASTSDCDDLPGVTCSPMKTLHPLR